MTFDEMVQALEAKGSPYARISRAQLAMVWAANRTHKEQPLRRLLYSCAGRRGHDPGADQASCNTETALRRVYSIPDLNRWAETVLTRASSVHNYSDAAAALGEIRTAGALLEAGFALQPIRTTADHPTSDFIATLGRHSVYVEVHTKQMNGPEATELAAYIRRCRNPQRARAVEEHTVIPGGRPSPGETIAENVASKFASIKAGDRQAVRNQPSVLWLDLQDEDWWPIDSDHLVPLTTCQGTYYVGDLWLAFYGWIGAPLFEHHSPIEGIRTLTRMRFPGRFRQKTAWDSVIISLPRTTVIFDNPRAKTPLPFKVGRQVTLLPFFDWSRSRSRWPSNLLFRLTLWRDALHLKVMSRVVTLSW